MGKESQWEWEEGEGGLGWRLGGGDDEEGDDLVMSSSTSHDI